MLFGRAWPDLFWHLFRAVLFFLAAGLNAILFVAGLCQLSVQVLLPPHCLPAPPLTSQLPATYPSLLMARGKYRNTAASPENDHTTTILSWTQN